MADYQRVVEYIRDVRSAPVQQVSDELRQYATEYAELCRHANERLRQCSQFLLQGLRSEAVHLAEEPPNLLDLVAALDLPDAEQWAEFCQQWELPTPQPLQMDRAAQLNEAYGQDQPLEELLKKHRLLALGQAPLRKRLEVMRQIAALDAASTFWEKDIRAFEHARIREMRLACQLALRSGDSAVIGELAAEIDNNVWLEPIPTDLRQAVNDAFEKAMRSEIEARLDGKLRDLRSAFGAKAHEDCARLLQEIKDMLLSANQSAVSPRVAAELQPVVAWVAQENQVRAQREAFLAECRKLAAAIASDAPQPALDLAYRRLAESEETLPEDIKEQYQLKRQERAMAARRKYIVRMALIGAAAVVAAIAVVLAFQFHTAHTWAQKIQAANKLRDVPLAQALIKEQERTSPRAEMWPELASAKKATAALHDRFTQDSKALDELLHGVSVIHAEAQLIAASDRATAEQLGAADTALRAALQRLQASNSLLWADPQQKMDATRSQLERLREQLRLKAIGRASGDTRTECEAMDKQVEAISASQGDFDAALNMLANLATKAKALSQRGEIDDATRTLVTAVMGRIDQRRAALEQAKSRLAELLTLRSKATSADELKKALDGFVSRYPQAGLSKDFAAASQRMPLAKAVEDWKTLAGGWGGKWAASGAVPTSQRSDAVQGYLTAHPRSPLAAPVSQYAAYLKHATEALTEKGLWHSLFSELLTNPLIAELAYMESSDGKRFYVLGDIKKRESGVNERKTITFEALDPAHLNKRRIVGIVPPMTLLTPKPVPAAHTKLAAELVDRLKLIDENNWDTWGIDVLDEVLRNERIDLVVRMILIQQAMKGIDQTTSWAIGSACEKALREIARLGVENILWFDADKPLSEATRTALTKALALVPRPEALRQSYAAARTQVFKNLSFTYVASGVLLRNESGAWSVYVSGEHADGSVAYVATGGSDSAQEGRLLAVAQVKSGAFVVDEAATRELPEGMMVFVSRP